MRYKKWLQAAFPLVVMLAALSAVLLARKGIPLQTRGAMLDYLATSSTAVMRQRDDADVLIAVDSENDASLECFRVTTSVLDSMRIPWRKTEMEQGPLTHLEGVGTLLVCNQNVTAFLDIAPELIDWIEGGGRLALMMTPEDNESFFVLSRKLGIRENAGHVQYNSLHYVTGLLPMWGGQDVYTCDGELCDFALAVTLEDDCTVHMDTGGASAMPLLWTRDIGAGRVAVNNTTLIQNKDGRGQAMVTLLALMDEVIYPIINAGMIFIDDFPAPQPEGTDQALMSRYGYNVQGFFRNHWWPDVKRLAMENGLRYTGVLIETYNDQVTGPYGHDLPDDPLIHYYASELLQSGGEIGLHGYNHIPLCLEGFVYGGESYVSWPSEQQMADSVRELYRYGSEFLIDTEFKTYVPPSNYLSDTGRKVLLDTLGQLRTISGLYLTETSVNALIQEFREEEDGTISVPRIAAGFAPNEFYRYVSAQELMLHGVVSHFVHPDDVLDLKRSRNMNWDQMFSAFSEFVRGVETTYPALRWSTASEGAAAVQRFDRLSVSRTEEADALTVDLSPFYGEAWLALKAERAIASVEHAECFKISENLYWLRADAARIRIRWEGEE